MKIFGVTGWKNSGKTEMVARLTAHFTGQGLRIATLKHAHRGFNLDQPGTDSDRHREAGAKEVLIASDRRWAILREEPAPSLSELVEALGPADLVLIEGWKREPHPKLECHRQAAGHALMAPENTTIRAVATDTGIETGGCPRFHIDDIAGIARFIETEVGL